MCRVLLLMEFLLGTFVLANCLPVIDFQFLLDPMEAQVALDKLDRITDVVEAKRIVWSGNLKDLETESSFESLDPRRVQDSLQTLKGHSDYRDFLEKYGRLRLTKEKEGQLKDRILLAGAFIDTVETLKGLLRVHDYIQFSEIRELIKTLRSHSFEIFTPGEAASEFGEICLAIASIRRPSVDLRKDYKELCF